MGTGDWGFLLGSFVTFFGPKSGDGPKSWYAGQCKTSRKQPHPFECDLI